MREIKFRAWDRRDWQQDRHSMVYYANFLAFPGDIDSGYDLMQYTGLKDKNGVEIYEGDILVRRYAPIYLVDEEERNYIGRVYWDVERASFGWKDENDYTSFIKPSESEVIGNIYENAELLEKAE